MKVQFSNFKLYLEGKETKFNSISLNETGFGPSTCVVTIPANANIMNVLPGTIIQLFYYWDPNPPSNGEERTDTQRYKIIFEGELHGKSFTKISGKEMAQLSFRSLFSTLNRTYKKAAASLTMEANYNGLFLALDSSSDEAFTFESPEYQQANRS